MGAIHLYLVRHGESVDNVANLFAGSRDAPLTAHGVLQARRLGTHLATRTASASAAITHIFTSNLQRAHRTAAAVRDAVAASQLPSSSAPDGSQPSSSTARAVEVVQLPELREKHFGTGEGQRFGARAGSGPDRPRHEGAEDQAAMRVRAERFFEGYLAPIIACVDAEPGDGAESIVIVAHGIILGVLSRVLRAAGNFAALGPVPEDQTRFSWSNTGYVEMRITTSRVTLPNASKDSVPTVKWPGLSLKTVVVNCTDHLRGLKKTRGGIGSAKFDEKQKTLSSFFAPTPKKRKHDELDGLYSSTKPRTGVRSLVSVDTSASCRNGATCEGRGACGLVSQTCLVWRGSHHKSALAECGAGCYASSQNEDKRP